MTSHNISSAIITTYPEQNLFHLDPPIYNLSPSSMEPFMELDTPEWVQSTLKQTQKTGFNPVCLMYGTSPLFLADDRMYYARLPLTAYQKPPQLPKIELPDDMVFVEQLNKQGNTTIIVARIGSEARLLKIFPEDMVNYVIDVAKEPDPAVYGDRGVRVDRFEQEKEAYAHLLHYGACEKGVAPHCYGWLELTPENKQRVSEVPGGEGAVPMLQYVENPVRAFVLEYFPDGVQLSYENLNEKVADQALRGLHEIHAAYVVHGDVHARNILVLPGDRVVWVDYNFSRTPSGELCCRRQELLCELDNGWLEFYCKMLPNKRIGHLVK